ncbi:RCC1 domain-containing protein [Paenibacillus glycinis]|uniref:RCC1 repeat- and reductase domain-containing protein n=1 Tax=Paenibacillus glycinis TaxID=2697035 RepID=A0ABW9XRG1_9BACL|nr:RCC1 repeat- and reductase domain-containing protein [Paenibacillus glycinis]NBD24942.1 RCC1 repeat- and reductase domain-containing protein [Paenibacillus glycinis]
MVKRSLRFMVIVCLVVGLVSVSNVAAAAEKTTQRADGGAFHTIALSSDGTVWAWGENWNGQLGNGSMDIGSNAPVQVDGVTDAVDVAAGAAHNLALKSDGTVWAWGLNYAGQVGDGTTTTRTTPVQVQGLDSVVAIAAGAVHSLALKSDGTLWAWGANDQGQLGDGTTTNRAAPVQVITQDSAGHALDVVAIAAGDYANLALDRDGTVWAWGSNDNGQIGTGSLGKPSNLVQVPNLASVVAVDASMFQCLALASDGTVWEWGGLQSDYEWGGDRIDPPFKVQGLDSVGSIAAGGYINLAVKDDGNVWAWGSSEGGQPIKLGDELRTEPPVQVRGLRSVAAIATGDYHNLAIESDGTLWSWGLNGQGQLGDGTTADRNAPVRIALNQTGSFQLSDTKSASNGGVMNEYALYYGYVSSPGQELSGSWSPPAGFHGTVTVSMVSPEGKMYDLSMETAVDGRQVPITVKKLPDGTAYGTAEIPEGYAASWSVKGHTAQDYSPNQKVFVYVRFQYDNR